MHGFLTTGESHELPEANYSMDTEDILSGEYFIQMKTFSHKLLITDEIQGPPGGGGTVEPSDLSKSWSTVHYKANVSYDITIH